MPTLTRDEAVRRALLLRVEQYDVDLDLTASTDPASTGARSTTRVRFACSEPGASTFAELKAEAVHEVVLNGRTLGPDRLRDNRIELPDLAADNDLLVVADVPLEPAAEGLHRFVDPVDGETYVTAHVGVDNAQRVFACFDQPDLKAVLRVTVRAPRAWTVVSNGVVVDRADDGSATTWRFAPTPRVSTYLLVVVAGPLHTVEATHRGLRFDLHCRRSLADHLDAQAQELLGVTRACFDRYAEMFDEPYPFDSYEQAFVPEHFWAAMETPGCVTLDDGMVFQSAVTEAQRRQRGMVVAHEMAHMWFGDLATMRWWDDTWLSESFAEYMGFSVLAEATDLGPAWTDFAMDAKAWGYDADQRPSTHPVAADPADVADTESALSVFDGISYSKGASALRQLVAWVGPQAFLEGVNDYLTRFRFADATLEDLLASLAAASGRDVAGWARAWLRTTGVDTLAVEVRGATLTLTPSGSRPHLVDVGVYDDGPGGSLVLRERVALDVDPGEPVEVALDREPAVVVPNDSDLTFAKVRLDGWSWERLAGSLSSLPSPLSRAVTWNLARDLVRDGDLAPWAYLELVRRHLPAESETSVVSRVLRTARVLVDTFLDVSARGAALGLLSATCADLLDRTRSSGADEQGRCEAAGLRLLAVRGLVSSAVTPDEVAAVRSWLDEGSVPGGPALDDDLRWRALARLCALGEAGPDDVDAQLRRDPSQTGGMEAARCRAALPSASAKEQAWAAAFDGALSGRVLTATFDGFWQPDQHDLVDPYVQRWFDEVPAVAARRGPSVTEVLGETCFPSYAATPGTVAGLERLLGRTDLSPGLRRQLVDRLDDTRRAVRGRSHPAGPALARDVTVPVGR